MQSQVERNLEQEDAQACVNKDGALLVKKKKTIKLSKLNSSQCRFVQKRFTHNWFNNSSKLIRKIIAEMD